MDGRQDMVYYYHIVKDVQFHAKLILQHFLHVDQILTRVIFRILPKSLQFFPFFGRHHIKSTFIKVDTFSVIVGPDN